MDSPVLLFFMPIDSKIAILADHLEQQLANPALIDGTIWDKMGLSRSAFYRLKPKASELLNERIQDRQKVIAEANTHAAVQAAKTGLKSRDERLLILQEQVDSVRDEIAKGKDVEYSMVKGKMKRHPRDMSAQTKAYLRRTLKDLQAEISKIEGDYAAEKRKLDFENPLVIKEVSVIPNEVDYKKLSDNVLEALMSASGISPKDAS